ncbi:Uncharacterized protein TCAP_04467 [Tolypocladium capitatum]|uniref:Transcription factor domain-containing protein n=1 Tax=Tolypocladium capitatum TaxID=45235 RepID=A0A2K3QDH2_9HYPO|nr:Uncharacterized protein TCAP_04467 [Tolypocladium capitatum]
MGDSLADDDDDRPAKRIKPEARPQRFQPQPAVPAGGAHPPHQAPLRLLPLSPQHPELPLAEQRHPHRHEAQLQPLLQPAPAPPPPPLPEHHHDNLHQHQHPPPPHRQAPQAHVGAPPASIAMAAMPPVEVFGGAWKWPSPSPMPPQSPMVVALQQLGSRHFNALDVFPTPTASPAAPPPPPASSGESIRNCPAVDPAFLAGFPPFSLRFSFPPVLLLPPSPSLTYHLSPTRCAPSTRALDATTTAAASAILSTPQHLLPLPLAATCCSFTLGIISPCLCLPLSPHRSAITSHHIRARCPQVSPKVNPGSPSLPSLPSLSVPRNKTTLSAVTAQIQTHPALAPCCRLSPCLVGRVSRAGAVTDPTHVLTCARERRRDDAMVHYRVHELTFTPALSAAELNLSPTSPTRASISRPHPYLHKRPRYPLPVTGDAVANGPRPRDQHQRKPTSNALLVSPFKDCVGNFGDVHHRRFQRPLDGKVNGYIKFNWPKDRQLRRSSSVHPSSSVSDSPDVSENVLSAVSATSLIPLGPAPASSKAAGIVPSDAEEILDSFSSFLNGTYSTTFDLSNSVGVSPATSSLFDFGSTGAGSTVSSTDVASIGAPRMVPQLFGYDAKMDQTDRKFWTFYIRNWCPGRSVLQETNLWLKDFAQMHKSDGVRAAIQSLAGIYIYDYQPINAIRKRVNDRFYDAESRLSRLLNDPTTAQNESHANELITIAVILSMQDIILTERRLKKPGDPRWLLGCKQGEMFLQASDRGSRFWKRSNAQLSSLRISQSIIIGRAVILAQPMMKLPAPDSFDPEHEASRFGWLLYGTEQDMYQIHGGCGFSKKLLHMISQITYCAARLQQDPGNIVVPMTAQYLLQELDQMRQWSSESKDWETAKAETSVATWVRSAQDGYVIDSSADMTDVTAEAWRLTAIIYLQCRVLRLPRNHPEVLQSLSDLARCIRIMPTSGYQFTAQAPLFPVFLLGMLATHPDHKEVSRTWFDEVVSTPVRSSVPPLYDALRRIWQWIDAEVELPSPTTLDLGPIGFRCPWWEHLVLQVDERESEVLCLT